MSSPKPHLVVDDLRVPGAFGRDQHLVGRGCPEDPELTNLRRKVESLPQIEQAKGLLMGYYGISADVAFEVLRRWSMSNNIKLRAVCADLVAAASQPAPGPFAGLRAAIGRLESGLDPTE